MDLRSVYPFWLLDKGIVAAYSSVAQDMQADIVIMGAGISGALASWYLRNSGLKIIIVDKRHVGMGSTAATTGLLQYEIDTPFIVLEKKTSKEVASRSYLLCRDAVAELGAIGKRFPEGEFTARPSFQYASWKKDVNPLRQEYLARKAIGIDLQWLESDDIKNKFGFSKSAGVLSKTGGEVNAYALTHALLRACCKKNLEVYDHSNIKTIQTQKKGFTLHTDEGFKIRTRHLIVACGYESANYLDKKIDKLQSTYAIVSEPLEVGHCWYKNALIWETATPYLYIRTTGNKRILVGGKDDAFSAGFKRDLALPRKAIELEMAFKKLFPDLGFKTDFKWAGQFASTKDGLPYIGTLPGKKNMYFALGFGGNGIVFSVLAGQIIRDLILRRPNRNAALFGFSR